MGKTKLKNNVLRVELDYAELASRLGVTPHYVRYLLHGERSNVSKLKEIRQIVLSEVAHISRSSLEKIIQRLDRLIADAELKGRA
ncbi:MAG: hypothetical protein M1469_01195 [Bacteroidetes bacterium]|nr:hypothetical protein [Bacteroidota bacterium]